MSLQTARRPISRTTIISYTKHGTLENSELHVMCEWSYIKTTTLPQATNVRIHISYTYNNTRAVEEQYNTNIYLKCGVVRAQL